MTESLSTPRKTQGWKKPVAITVALAMVVAAIGYAYASPYIAVKHMKAAADARDAVALNEYVDYPALRLSLKQQVGEMLQRRVEGQHSSNPLLILGAVIGAALISPLVDAYATPEGVAALLDGMPPTGKPGDRPHAPPPAESGAPSTQSAEPAQSAPAPAAPPAPAASGNPAPEARPVTTAGYRGLNEFALTWDRGNTGEHYAAILQRHGLFSWKLSAVELNEGNVSN
ncbi:DUF2939 domain-containing protein [Paraburkholderia sp. CNPSo 3076]|uniref:DUF2939 domain-containing protein n=1 Tax=Paraburkholderia sp. CNPSo 3076 TaxID=2940936 RepID=UPI00224ED4A2|nr:DUF2939 domain-containing protein [Paraburkholderia sp. CNPSo 3076]MCX5540286.1 DUF2939 domain-containing protein [Paraburkholderia sp. CNPSo 3076]